MTEITDEGRKLAAELANAEGNTIPYVAADFSRERDSSLKRGFARLATEHLALKAEHEKAVADLREIDRQFEQGGVTWCTQDPLGKAQTIAAKYRETDPLVEAVNTVLAGFETRQHAEDYAGQIRAELSKRGFELARVKP